MPTYQYACTACGEQSEVVQKFTDDPLTVCEACGGRLRKVFSPVGIVFKGPGFYRTDSRSAAKKEPVGAGQKQNGSGDGAKPAAGSPSGGSSSSDSAANGSSASGSSSGGSSPANGSTSSGTGSANGSKSSSKVA